MRFLTHLLIVLVSLASAIQAHASDSFTITETYLPPPAFVFTETLPAAFVFAPPPAKPIEKAVTPAVKLTPSYPTRGNLWSHPGISTREQLLQHLRTVQHAGHFSEVWLASATLADLEAAHSDDHEGRLKAPAAKAVAAAPKGHYENRQQCTVDRWGRKSCSIVQVWVPDQ